MPHRQVHQVAERGTRLTEQEADVLENGLGLRANVELEGAVVLLFSTNVCVVRSPRRCAYVTRSVYKFPLKKGTSFITRTHSTLQR